jgi:hypothetical protein
LHETHDSTKDSLLIPFSPDDKVPLNTSDNLALLHYLGEFEKIFCDENNLLKELLQVLDSELLRLKQEKKSCNKQTSPEEYRQIVSAILNSVDCYYIYANQCNRVLNKHIYYQTLFHSRHNTLFVLPQTMNNKGCQDSAFYKKAINVHTSIESIKLIREELLEKANKEFLYLIYINSEAIAAQTEVIAAQGKDIKELTKESSELSSKLTRQFAIWGIIISIITSSLFFLLSLTTTYSPKNDIKKLDSTQIVIRNQINTLNNIQSQQVEKIQELNKLILELKQDIKETKESTQKESSKKNN